MNSPSQPDVLVYRGTDTEIRLGDLVTYRSFLLFPKKPAVVHYVPGQSPPHPAMLEGDLPSWAILQEDGALLVWPYLPGELPASRGLTFVSRGEAAYAGLQPSDPTGIE